MLNLHPSNSKENTCTVSPFLKQTAIRDISLFPGSKEEGGWNQTIL